MQNVYEVCESKLHHIPSIVDYFLESSPGYLQAMGANPLKLPNRNDWIDSLVYQYQKPYKIKSYYYVIWNVDDVPVGHSNINHIIFGESATMHLHIWNSKNRKKGMGLEFLKLSIPYYFKNFNLQTLICEPFANNPAPNKTLPKLGFTFVKKYETIPGPINYKQEVCRYELSIDRFKEIYT